MKIEIVMPQMGESITDGTIIKWHKQKGEYVKKDEIIYEISTDKVDTEIPSPEDGVLVDIKVKEQETVNVGTVVAILETNAISSSDEKEEQEKGQAFEAANQTTDLQLSITKNQTLTTNHQQPTTSRFYSPLVLRIAREEGISIAELDYVEGSGRGGRITKNDVLNYIHNKKSGKLFSQVEGQITPTNETEAEQSNSVQTNHHIQVIPMDYSRQKILQHMVYSRDTSVHVTQVMEVDMSIIYNFVETKRDLFAADGVKLTYMPFVSFAVIKALKEFPLMNASIDGKNIVMKKFINLGIAVAVQPNGLIVPNIKNAEEKSVRGLARAIADLGNRARTKKLVPEDVMNGTFSITNYGVFGSLFGTPIINQPEVGILGVGAITKKAVVVEVNGSDAIVIKPMMYLSLSHDHRLIDGLIGGKFLKSIKQTLENFDTSIV